jgi:flagellar hook assembly protein FlgD
MKRYGFIIALMLSISLYAETTVKNSAPFSFPTAVNVRWGQQGFMANEESFVAKARFSGSGTIAFSWSLPVSAKKGNIAVFSVSGSLVKMIPISSQRGTVAMDMAGGKLSRGVYFAKLSYGAFERTINFIVCR